jgi:hypothetical protein
VSESDTVHQASVWLGVLNFENGAHVLIKHALDQLPAGGALQVRGEHPELADQLRLYARNKGHGLNGSVLFKSASSDLRWTGAERSGDPHRGCVVESAPRNWGLAARGALIEPGGPSLSTIWNYKQDVWSDRAADLYALGVAAQWDPEKSVDWTADFVSEDFLEDAVVQVMTYLIENEQLALVIPSRYISQIHPQFREVQQVLAVQAADEARHIEIFSRRALLRRDKLGTSSVLGRRSLQTILQETEMSVASFLLSVLGEGTFLHLLAFLERHGPDPVTRQVSHLALVDEARHVAFGMAHLEESLVQEPTLRGRLSNAVIRRHEALAGMADLNDQVLNALVLIGAGSRSPHAVGEGFAAVRMMQVDMHETRRRRLLRLGFSPAEALKLSSLHTKNFM